MTSTFNFLGFTSRAALVLACLLAINANVFSQLSGTYTIGGTMPDYFSFNDAVFALEMEGVSGPVVFNIREGVYDEQLTIPAIANTSEVNTITFQSENLNAAGVELAHEPEGSPYYVVSLSGCSYVQFRHMSITTLAPVFARVLVTSGAKNILIEHCIFNGSTQACADPEGSVLIYTNFGGGSDDWIIRSNVFNDACMQIESYDADNWLIEDNDFNNALTYGLFAGSGEGLVIHNNRSNIYTGMYFTQQNGLVFTGNDWKGRLTFDGPSGTSEEHTIIANNFFYGSLALELIYAEFLDILNNSFYATSSCIYTQYGGNMNVINNIFYATGGVAVNGFNTASFGNCYNNNFYSESPNLIEWNGVTYSSVAEWQANTTYGSNSVNIEPLYYSDTDLHVCNANLDGLAVPIEGITSDIDGQTRDSLNPDLGADEFELDVCECTLSAVANVTSDYNGQAISCFGQQDGTAFCEVSGASGEVSYSWSSGALIAEAIYLGAGEHICTVTDESCSVEAIVYISDPQPVNVIILDVVNPTCPEGNNGEITSLGNGGTMDFTYSWSPAGGENAVGAQLEGGVQYTVSIMDSNGCLATTSLTLDSPEVPEVFASNDVEICAGTAVTIWASGGETYEWSEGLGDEWEVEVTPEMTTTYVVTGYNLEGCSAQDEVTVTILDLPEVTVADFDPSDVCIDAVPIAIPTTSPSGGTVSGTGVNEGFFVPELAGVGEHQILYEYTNEFGCSGSATTGIEVHDLPVVTLGAFVEPAVCLDSSPIDVPAGSPTGGNYNGLGVAGGQFDPSVAGLGTHDVSYIYTDEHNCYSWDIQQITVNDLPEVTLEAFGTDSLCTSDTAIPLPVGSPSGGLFSGDGVVGNGFDPGEAGAGLHTVTYSYEDDNGCAASAETTIQVFDCTSIAVNRLGQSMKVYPNPNQGSFYVEIPHLEKGSYALRLINAVGTVAIEETMKGAKHLTEGRSLEPGVYFLQVFSDDDLFQMRVVIE